jgi:glycosyltransferase involved in cell wall biosynthesis
MPEKRQSGMTNNDTPLVSIVTPTFNSAPFIARLFQCIAEQSYKNIEHIIIDGGSTDGTLGILRQQSQAKWISEPDKGMYDAINKGMKMASGSILAYLNADDLYSQDTVERVVAYFGTHENVDLVFSDVRYIDENEQTLFIRKYPPYSWKFFTVLDGSTVPQQTAFWRRRVFDAVGFFDSSFRMAGDFEFFVRVGKSCSIRKVPGPPLAQFRFHGAMQTINQKALNDKEIVRIHDMYGFHSSVGNSLLKLVATLRYRANNAHRVKDKFIALVSGKKQKYRP